MRIPEHPAIILRKLQHRLKKLVTACPGLAASFGTYTHRCGRPACRCHHGGPLHTGQHLRPAVAELVIELAAGSQLQQVQCQTPPGQEAAHVGAVFLHPRIGQAIQPGVQLREEVADGLHQGTPGD